MNRTGIRRQRRPCRTVWRWCAAWEFIRAEAASRHDLIQVSGANRIFPPFMGTEFNDTQTHQLRFDF